MTIFTPHGLKIRLDPERLHVVLKPLSDILDIEDAMLDSELWTSFCNGISALAALGVAALSRSGTAILVAALSAYILAYLFQQITYVHSLKVLIPQFLGGWLIYLPASVTFSIYLYLDGSSLAALCLMAVLAVNYFPLADSLFLLVTFPLLLILMKATSLSLGDSERAFIGALNRQAHLAGRQLDWSLYDR